MKVVLSKAGFPLGDIFSREQAKHEYDWLVMSSVFVASQSSCFFLCSREQIRLVENRLNGNREFTIYVTRPALQRGLNFRSGTPANNLIKVINV